MHSCALKRAFLPPTNPSERLASASFAPVPESFASQCSLVLSLYDAQAPIGVENSRLNRVRYRELLFKTAALGEYISGAICFEETLFDTASCGTPMIELMTRQGIIPGIKVEY